MVMCAGAFPSLLRPVFCVFALRSRFSQWMHGSRVVQFFNSFLLVLALCVCGVHARAEEVVDTTLLRDNIVTLQPVYDGVRQEYLSSLRMALGRRGYRTASDLLDDYVNGGFLNGVVVRWGDRQYVLTSRHGVELVNRVEVERAGGQERLGSCEVVYSQGASDLAVLALPADFEAAGLQLDTTIRDWGAGLVVAGYEGLGGEPQWIIESGHEVLRSAAYRKGKSWQKGRRYIEYDAMLDPGMTGSALLAAGTDEETDLRLVGINIWKGTLQGGRAVAVSAAEVARVLRQLEGRGEQGEFEGASLARAIHAGGDTLGARLSDGYLISVPVERVFLEHENMPREERRVVLRMLKDGESVEGVRRILASALHRGYSRGDVRVASDGDFHELSAQGSRVPLEVVRERGEWRVEDLALPEEVERKRYGLSQSVSMRGTARVAMEIPMYGKEGNSGSFRFSYMQWTYFFFQIGGGYGRYGFDVVDSMTMTTQEVLGSYLSLTPSLGVQLPVKLNTVLLLPYVRGFYGMHYSLQKRQAGFQFFTSYRAVPGFGLGADVAYRIKEGLYIVGGIGGQYVLISSNFGGGKMRGFGIEVSLGIGF